MLNGNMVTDTKPNPWLRCKDTDGNDKVECKVSDVPTCECDERGRQSHKDGDW